MATSSIPTFITALEAQLKARDGLDGVLIDVGTPSGELPREFIIFGRIDLGERAAALGHRRREENYTSHLIVDVLQAGRNATNAMLRAFDLVAEIENQLRDDPQVDGTVIAAQIAGGQVDPRHTPKDRECQVDLSIDVKARI